MTLGTLCSNEINTFPPLLDIVISRTSLTTGVWLLNSISENVRSLKKATYFSNAPVSMLKTAVGGVNKTVHGHAHHLPIIRFSTLVVRLGCNPLGAASSGPTPSKRWPSGVTATLCN